MLELDSYSHYLALVAVVIGMLRYKEFRGFYFKYILFYLIYVMVSGFLADVILYFFDFTNCAVHNVFILVHFSFFIAWFHAIISSKWKRNVLKIFFFIYVLFWALDALFLKSFLNDYTSYSFLLGTIFLIIVVGFYFSEMLEREVVLHITRSPYFWVSFGILIYSVTYLPFYLTLLFFTKESPFILSLMTFIINFILYCCFAIAFFRADRNLIEHPVS